MPEKGSTSSLPVSLFEQDGDFAVSRILLTLDAAKKLRDALQSALAAPEALEKASWPGEIVAFPVIPMFKGREQYVSFHINSGKTPFSRSESWRRRIWGLLNVIFVCIGLIAIVSWLLSLIG